nr:hypothetical protein [Elizabethkingia bruuniana]
MNQGIYGMIVFSSMKKAGLSKMAIGKCSANIKFEHEKEPNYILAYFVLATQLYPYCNYGKILLWKW